MEALKILIGIVLPYITIVVLVGGMVYRIVKWYKMPSPGKLTLFPAPPPGGGLVLGILKETFFLRTLFRGDKVLWSGSWGFHIMLVLIFLGHFRVVTDFPRIWRALGMGVAEVDTMSAVLGGGAGLIILIGSLYLLIRRFALPRVRDISTVADYLILILIIAIILTGDYMRLFTHFDLKETRVYFSGLLTFSPQLPKSNFFLFHFLLGQILLMCVPFSKIMHFGGIFFSQTLVQRR
jgi:nitrate reductase gamma subunit